jgi:hypothetical protein
MRPTATILLSALILFYAAAPARAERADAAADAGPSGPDCVIIEGPTIDCPGETDEAFQPKCGLTARVKNRGDVAAQYVYLICVTRFKETEKLAQLTWRRVGFGLLKPSSEFTLKVSYEYLGFEKEECRNEFSMAWKDRIFSNTQAERCSIEEKTVLRYDTRQDKSADTDREGLDASKQQRTTSARIMGFIVNDGEQSGFAPRLLARIKDESGKTVDTIRARVPLMPLEPGEKLPFVIGIPELDEGLIDNIGLEFENAKRE